MSTSKYHVPNLERALRILDVLSQNPKGMNQKELIDALEVSKNSIYRITMTLLDHGYIGKDDVSRKYFLTRKMMVVGATAMGDQNIVNRSIGTMQGLRDVIDASVYLAVLEDTEGVIIEQAIGGSPFKFSVDLGSRFDLHCGAPGKAMLAFLPEEESDELIKQLTLTKYNERTITTKKALKKEMAEIRKRGYAIDRAEQFEGCHCVGTVILDHRDYPIAMVWATTTSFSLPEERFAEVGEKLCEYVNQISEKFGHKL